MADQHQGARIWVAAHDVAQVIQVEAVCQPGFLDRRQRKLLSHEVGGLPRAYERAGQKGVEFESGRFYRFGVGIIRLDAVLIER